MNIKMKWLNKLLGKVECRVCKKWIQPSIYHGNICYERCLKIEEKEKERIQKEKEKNCKRHKWSHEGFEWYEGILFKNGKRKYYGKHFCIHCGKIDNCRPIKKPSGEAVAQASQRRDIQKALREIGLK